MASSSSSSSLLSGAQIAAAFAILASLSVPESVSASFGSYRRVATGGFHACGIDENPGNKLQCWGDNLKGQLGLGVATLTIGTLPTDMGLNLPFINLGGVGAAEVAAGFEFTCAILDNGSLKCWGDNAFGQLGLGVNTPTIGNGLQDMTTLPVVDLGGVPLNITLGHDFACALMTTRDIKCWGNNNLGQLGLGSKKAFVGAKSGEMGTKLPIVNINAPGAVVKVSAGASHACALTTAGAVMCWGSNTYGQLGLGSTKAFIGKSAKDMGTKLKPVNLGLGITAVDISCGSIHTCARLSNGNLKCWGDNTYFQLGRIDGNGPFGDKASEMGDGLPTITMGGSITIDRLTSGARHTCIVTSDFKSKCWGEATFGELGGNPPGVTPLVLNPIKVGTGLVASEIVSSSSASFSCVILNNGKTKCFGQNTSGALGYCTSAVQIGFSSDDMGDNLKYVDTCGTTNAPTTTSPTNAPPSAAPTTISPTKAPTTVAPTKSPTTMTPTVSPTTMTPTTTAPTSLSPTASPITSSPTAFPTTATPTAFPTTVSPTSQSPTKSPTTATPTTMNPTLSPIPALTPTFNPTTISPTTTSPTTASPTTLSPTASPITATPTASPTTTSPTTLSPSKSPTTSSPSKSPTTVSPTTMTPTLAPVPGGTPVPSKSPTTLSPTASPTFSPSIATDAPTPDPNNIFGYDMKSLDLYVLIDASIMEPSSDPLCKTISTSLGTGLDCLSLYVAFTIDLIAKISSAIGFTGVDPTLGLRVSVLGFGCKGKSATAKNLNPVIIPIVPSLSSDATFINNKLTQFVGAKTDGGSCPQGALARFIQSVEDNWTDAPNRPYRALMTFTDGLLFTKTLTLSAQNAVTALRQRCTMGLTATPEIGAKQLTSDEKASQIKYLGMFTGNQADREFELKTGSATALSKLCLAIGELAQITDSNPLCADKTAYSTPQSIWCGYPQSGPCDNRDTCYWIDKAGCFKSPEDSVCGAFKNQGACQALAGCQWTKLKGKIYQCMDSPPVTDCSALTYPKACKAKTQCMWNGGSCVSNNPGLIV